MELKTERLCLRPITRKDLRAVLAYACDLSNAEYMVYYPKTEQEAVSYVEETASQWEEEEPITYEFAVLLDGEMIGTVSLWLEEADGVEIGWILNRHYWAAAMEPKQRRQFCDLCQKSWGFLPVSRAVIPEI